MSKEFIKVLKDRISIVEDSNYKLIARNSELKTYNRVYKIICMILILLLFTLKITIINT